MAGLPTLKQLDRGIEIYDTKDIFVYKLKEHGDQKVVPISMVSKNMQSAIVAAEDHRFYDHSGIDPVGIARAARRNHEAGRVVEGGSTITQQVVRNLYLNPRDKSYARKIAESLVAMSVDARYSKQKILETYLNLVYFGEGAYGIESAANYYFGKPAKNLSLSESAFLAGLIKAPTVLGSPENRAAALTRQKDVLGDMQKYKMASLTDISKAKSDSLKFTCQRKEMQFGHYISAVSDTLRKELGDKMWQDNWKVYTHLDVKAQISAEQVMNKGIENAPRGLNQGALVCLNLENGGVKALVGGIGSYKKNKWNRATHPHTVGSVMKPFVYLAALTDGVIKPDSMINDSPIVITSEGSEDWVPKNYDGEFKGWVTARQALTTSRNVCSVRVAQAEGLPRVIEVAHKAGIQSQLDPYPSLALGYCALSPLEVATAYGTLARGGVKIPAVVVRKIAKADGHVEREFNASPNLCLPRDKTLQLLDVLKDAVAHGTGVRARVPGVEVAGKTGTASGARDVWFVGATPETVTAVWVGNDQNKPVRGKVTGGSVCAGLWNKFVTQLHKNNPPKKRKFDRPEQALLAQNPNIYGGASPAYNYTPYQQQSYLLGLRNATKTGIASAFDVARMSIFERQGGWSQPTRLASVQTYGSNNNVVTYNYAPLAPSQSASVDAEAVQVNQRPARMFMAANPYSRRSAGASTAMPAYSAPPTAQTQTAMPPVAPARPEVQRDYHGYDPDVNGGNDVTAQAHASSNSIHGTVTEPPRRFEQLSTISLDDDEPAPRKVNKPWGNTLIDREQENAVTIEE